jgi:phage repressor protein C with HTH and peptisase S24 domain
VHTIGNRLKVWRESLSLKQADAASVLGLPPSTYQNYERDVRAPNTEGWNAFAMNGINTNWLLTGEGSMLAHPSEKPFQHPSATGASTEEAEPQAGRSAAAVGPGFTALPLYDGIRASGGDGALSGEDQAENVILFSEDWIRREFGAKPRNLFMIRVAGDSMEPTLRAGDFILVDRRTSRPDREGVYLLRMGEMLLVKRLQALPGGKIRASSDNAAFDPFVLDADESGGDVQIHGRIIWASRRL